MTGLSTDVLSILLFMAIVLGQLLMQLYRKRQEARRPPAAGDADDTLAQDADDEDDDTETVGDRAAPAMIAVPAKPPTPMREPGHAYIPLPSRPARAAPKPVRRHSRRALLGTTHRVQDAVVVAAILGRCRAVESHDPER